MKIIGLIPCLMQDNNRNINNKCLDKAYNKYGLDEIVIYDQMFEQTDYKTDYSNVKYIGHATEKKGFVVPRNKLLEYFYNSDADYAMFFDANEYCSDTCMNELLNLFKSLREGSLDVDCIVSTMGIQISTERAHVKQRPDYKEVVTLLPIGFRKGIVSGSYTMHGMIIKNFKKYYNITPYIDERCDPRKGTSEDTYFGMLIRRSFNCYLAPTLCFTKSGGSGTSTWMTAHSGYAYPKVDSNMLIKYVVEANIADYHKDGKFVEIKIPRVIKDYVENLKDYKPRPRKDKRETDGNKVSLFV